MSTSQFLDLDVFLRHSVDESTISTVYYVEDQTVLDLDEDVSSQLNYGQVLKTQPRHSLS